MNKWLYSFTINKTEEIQTEEKSKNNEGEDTTTVKKEIKETPITLKIRKPNRRLYDDADLFKAKNVGQYDGDQSGNTGDNKKLLNIGWKPIIKLEDGINKFYNDIRSSNEQ